MVAVYGQFKVTLLIHLVFKLINGFVGPTYGSFFFFFERNPHMGLIDSIVKLKK
jgi:hypothetical protein